MRIATLVSIFFVLAATSCAPPIDVTEVSIINFETNNDIEFNTKFSESLFKYARTKQIRGGPIGFSSNVGDPYYEIAIIGTCENFIEDTEHMISRSGTEAAMPEKEILSLYKSSAVCRTESN